MGIMRLDQDHVDNQNTRISLEFYLLWGIKEREAQVLSQSEQISEILSQTYKNDNKK